MAKVLGAESVNKASFSVRILSCVIVPAGDLGRGDTGVGAVDSRQATSSGFPVAASHRVAKTGGHDVTLEDEDALNQARACLGDSDACGSAVRRKVQMSVSCFPRSRQNP